MFLNKILPCALLAVLIVSACKKDDAVTTPSIDFTSATDDARAEDAFNDMMQQVDNAADASHLRQIDDACAPVITFDTTAMPHSLLIDFGSSNCTATNGRTRRGKLSVTFTGAYSHPGTVITITPVDYYVNNNHVQGTKTVTNMGTDDNGHIYFNITVDGTLTAADGTWTATHHATRTRTWIEGSDTPSPLDDVYLITGSGSGTNRNSVNYTVNITSALRVAVGCAFITQGTVVVTPQNGEARTIDYGNGTCDNTFTVTVNGTSYTITIG